jgi:hypothetical protein
MGQTLGLQAVKRVVRMQMAKQSGVTPAQAAGRVYTK